MDIHSVSMDIHLILMDIRVRVGYPRKSKGISCHQGQGEGVLEPDNPPTEETSGQDQSMDIQNIQHSHAILELKETSSNNKTSGILGLYGSNNIGFLQIE